MISRPLLEGIANKCWDEVATATPAGELGAYRGGSGRHCSVLGYIPVWSTTEGLNHPLAMLCGV